MDLQITKSDALKIVGDAAIASGSVGDGRFIILLIIDHSGRTDIEDLFKVHQTTEGGEVKVKWGAPLFSKDIFVLHIEFTSPIPVNFSIEFNIKRHGLLVDNIINNKAVYLQLGKKGDRLKDDLNKNKILLEIPDTGIKIKWESLWKKSLVERFRSKGYSRSESKELATNTISEMRKLKNLKMI